MYGIAGGGRLVLILDVIIASESVVRETKIIRKKFEVLLDFGMGNKLTALKQLY